MQPRPQVHAISIVDAIVNHLREALFTGELTPGASLPEQQLATTYDVARPTARAAIERLVAEGLLSRDRHRTARVPQLTEQDIRDLYLAREFVEGEAVRRLAALRRCPPAAEEANAELDELGPVYSTDVVERDLRFHSALVDAVGSERVSTMYLNVVGEVRLGMAQVQVRGLMDASSIAAEHRTILRHVKSGHVEYACRALSRHVAGARDRLLTSMRAADSATEGRPDD